MSPPESAPHEPFATATCKSQPPPQIPAPARRTPRSTSANSCPISSHHLHFRNSSSNLNRLCCHPERSEGSPPHPQRTNATETVTAGTHRRHESSRILDSKIRGPSR